MALPTFDSTKSAVGRIHGVSGEKGEYLSKEGFPVGLLTTAQIAMGRIDSTGPRRPLGSAR